MSARLKNYEAKRMRNKHRSSEVKTYKKKFLESLKGSKEDSLKIFQVLDKKIQQLKSKNVIHAGKAKRMISRLRNKIED